MLFCIVFMVESIAHSDFANGGIQIKGSGLCSCVLTSHFKCFDDTHKHCQAGRRIQLRGNAGRRFPKHVLGFQWKIPLVCTCSSSCLMVYTAVLKRRKRRLTSQVAKFGPPWEVLDKSEGYTQSQGIAVWWLWIKNLGSDPDACHSDSEGAKSLDPSGSESGSIFNSGLSVTSKPPLSSWCSEHYHIALPVLENSQCSSEDIDMLLVEGHQLKLWWVDLIKSE